MGIEASRVSCPKELLRPKHVMYTVSRNKVSKEITSVLT